MSRDAAQPLLSVRDLCIEFSTERGVLRAVDGVSFDLEAGQTLGIVGESGCGKTVTSLSLLGLVPSPPGKVVGGSIELEGQDIVVLPEHEMRKLRGNTVSMIFQEPMTALNPVFRIGEQMQDVLRRHTQMTRKQTRAHAIELLGKVGIPSPGKRIDEYPHQLSGGMRQRVMIAMALSCEPRILVADEPTTALDVTTQAQVMELIFKLQQELHMAMILITHDLGVVAESCERALVMYCGRVVEDADIHTLFAHPQHPYTAGLMRSIPRIRETKLETLPIIRGMVPDLLHLPDGCRFAERCELAKERCRAESPVLRQHKIEGSQVACHTPN